MRQKYSSSGSAKNTLEFYPVGLSPAIADKSEKDRWDAELREHVAGDVPHFDRIERHVTHSLRVAGVL